MRHASVSVASKIAEGRGRLNVAEFRHLLGLAQGSVYELHTQLVVAKCLNLGDTKALTQAESLSNEVSKMVTGFIQKLSAGINRKKPGDKS